ncbi:uncharacterized protein K452DRAFT_94527 [Aplosporella prunicola CBS 121167]|uniref:Uncharacterized protein n=1 Tax=Aplosporella prunicola CBS 121167 TaxID=1176127 RepID=A0A6A6B518_9PEZI|nr:uncharacterized protein K452DRAFT_94527 [Aplosporella prunicola CBS 121167]KAF2138057.1 hypothetical protein K452DRAFT_94527 [Aplosporella prunicola CBS 121167]
MIHCLLVPRRLDSAASICCFEAQADALEPDARLHRRRITAERFDHVRRGTGRSCCTSRAMGNSPLTPHHSSLTKRPPLSNDPIHSSSSCTSDLIVQPGASVRAVNRAQKASFDNTSHKLSHTMCVRLAVLPPGGKTSRQTTSPYLKRICRLTALFIVSMQA